MKLMIALAGKHGLNVQSVTGTLRGVWAQAIGDHLRGSIAKSLVEQDQKLLGELMEHLQKIR